MGAKVNYENIQNPKDSLLVVPIEKCSLKIKHTNHITQYAKNRIDYSSYAQLVVLALCKEDSRYMQVSDSFYQHILIPAIGAEMASVNLKNKSKTEINFPNYVQLLKGLNYFYKNSTCKQLNQAEFSIVQEIEFIKESLNHKAS